MRQTRRERSEKGSPLYLRTAEALENILARTSPGTFLPSEPALSRELGVSRATLREAMRAFEERGVIIRRQGVGTIVARPLPVIDAGLEVLESIETLAGRIGLEVEMGDLAIDRRSPNSEEQRLFDVPAESTILEVSRVIEADSRPVAYLVDVVPHGVVSDRALQEGFRGSVLDLLLKQGTPALGLSRSEITAVPASADVGRRLKVQRGDVLLRFEAFLYAEDGKMIDHSHSYFLPGTFRFHVVRRVGRRG
jgi:GntR family transcriptional regulator